MGASKSIKKNFQKSFETRCFRLLGNAYDELNVQEGLQVINLNENDISELLNKKINKDQLSIEWSIVSTTEEKIFENQKIEKGFADKLSRIDFKMQTIHFKQRFFYHVEAKNLKENDKPLMKRYIKTGIDNFLSKKYSNGCLVGYLLEGNVDSTILNINALIEDSHRNSEVLKKVNCDLHECYYESNHKEIEVLKHLILDFT
jgi:hypothetical protein